MTTPKVYRTLLFFLLLSTSTYAQVDDVKKQIYDAKVARSPAQEDIKTIDIWIGNLESYAKRGADAIFRSSSYSDFKNRYRDATNRIPIIKEKDPKWKTQIQIDKLEAVRPIHEELMRLQSEFDSLKAEYEYYDKLFSLKDEKFRGVWSQYTYQSPDIESANKFYHFVTKQDTSGLDWSNFAEQHTKANEVKAKYLAELKSFGEKADEEYHRYRGLDFFIGTGGATKTITTEFKQFINYISKEEIYNSVPDPNKTAELIKISKNHKILLDAWMAVYPVDSELKTIHPKVTQYYEKLASTFKSQVAVSDFHNEIIQGMYFSNHPIEFGKEKASDYQTSFKSNDPIYLIEYFPVKKDLSLYYTDVVPKESPNRLDLTFYNEGMNNASALQVLLIPGTNNLDLTKYHETLRLIDYLVDTDKNQINLKVEKETITIDASAGKDNYTKILNEFSAYRKNNIALPKGTSETVPSGIEQACNEFGYKETLVKTVAYSNFEYAKSYAGIILSRAMEAVLYFKDKDGNCFFRIVVVQQEKIGSGYGKPEIFGTGYIYSQQSKNGFEIKHEADAENGGFYYTCR